jgi:hypothetical protein
MLCQFDDDLLGGSIIATVPRLQRRILAFSILGNNWGRTEDERSGFGPRDEVADLVMGFANLMGLHFEIMT